MYRRIFGYEDPATDPAIVEEARQLFRRNRANLPAYRMLGLPQPEELEAEFGTRIKHLARVNHWLVAGEIRAWNYVTDRSESFLG